MPIGPPAISGGNIFMGIPPGPPGKSMGNMPPSSIFPSIGFILGLYIHY
jgi:hypothetical protein